MPSNLTLAAEAFLKYEGGRGPDFSGCLVLVPHHHAGLAFRRALSEALPGRHLLPPRLLTLPELSGTSGLDVQAEADSLRLAQLRDFLARSGRIPSGSLWDAARELLDVLNELDGAGAGEGTLARLPAGANPYLSLEAEIVLSVWQALGRGGSPGRVRVHALRLSRLLRDAGRPLYVLGLDALLGIERDFLDAWRDRAPVVELPAPPPAGQCLELLHSAWGGAEPALDERARQFARRCPSSPLPPERRLLAAPGLEAAARAAEKTLLAWLAEGRRNIALVALDRVMARRLRALLERRGILVQDETGWAFATASASHAVECWLRLVTGDAWFRDLLDFLKSPFIFADAGAARVAAAHELDEAFRRHGAPDGLAGHIELARREGLHAAHGLLKRIERAGDGFARGRRALHEWMRRLLDSLQDLAAADALRADPVGAQLWALLERLAAESAAHPFRYRAVDWRRWLFLHLDKSTFLDATVSSPLRLTHLAAAHHRDLEGAILLGVGAATLPGPARGGIFNDATRAQLGLPGAEERERQLRAALIDVMARTPRVALIWQTEQGGEPAPLSPWLVHLDAFHRAAWGSSWVTPADVAPIPASMPVAEAADQASAPRAEAVPRRLSVSAWQSLVACPYQFFARHLIKLNDRDEVPEEMDKADYGSLVHRILARFHQAHPILAEHVRDELAAALLATGRELFAEAEARGYLALAWRLRWERQVAAYVAWALEREAEGYRFSAAEAPLAREVAWGDGGGATLLHGRADRLDERAGAAALLDYKTQSRDVLRKKLAADGEDVQLTAYAWLAGAREAGFVSVDADKVEALAWPGDLPAAAEAEAERLCRAMADLAAGMPLPARGAPTTCAWCEMRGLCRREHQDPPQA